MHPIPLSIENRTCGDFDKKKPCLSPSHRSLPAIMRSYRIEKLGLHPCAQPSIYGAPRHCSEAGFGRLSPGCKWPAPTCFEAALTLLNHSSPQCRTMKSHVLCFTVLLLCIITMVRSIGLPAGPTVLNRPDLATGDLYVFFAMLPP